MQTLVYRSMAQEMEAKFSSMDRKFLFAATKGTSSMGLTSGAAMRKGSGLGYSLIVSVNKFSILLLLHVRIIEEISCFAI